MEWRELMSDAAITVIVAGILQLATIVAGFLTIWVKLRYGVEKAEEAATKAQTVEKKIDANTAITKGGVAAAVTSAKVAAVAAAEAKVATDTIHEKLNGRLDKAINDAVAPVEERLHKLAEYVHERNHHLLDEFTKTSNKVELIFQLLQQKVK